MSSFVIFNDNCFSYANSLIKKNIVLFSMHLMVVVLVPLLARPRAQISEFISRYYNLFKFFVPSISLEVEFFM